MWRTIATMYITLLPIIIGGVMNSVFCATGLLKALKKPMDGGKCLKDGERIFGENKTWKGFLGYILFGTLCALLWGLLSTAVPKLAELNFFYRTHENTLGYNCLIGALMGLFYGLFELPNSFLKRRLHIVPGKNPEGFWRVFFIFLDQADSAFGCVLVVCMFCALPVWFYFVYVFLGAATHIVLNMLLYLVHARKNMF